MEAALGRYLTSTPEARKILREEMPDLFTEDVLEELDSAERIMKDARVEAADVMRTGRTLFSGLGVSESISKDDPTTNGSGTSISTDQFNVLSSAEGQVESFQAILTSLLSQQLTDEDMVRQIEERMKLVSEACPAMSAGLTSSSNAEESKPKDALLPTDVLMKVFSYLPIEDIIDTTEHVCGKWNRVTTDNSQAQSFWIGCAHREFPSEVAALIAAEGASLFEADWRTIAVMAAASAGSECDDAESE